MNSLAKEGFVILGGPLEGTSDVLLVIRATSPDEARSRLAEDPWAAKDLLRITRVAPWTLRLGSLEWNEGVAWMLLVFFRPVVIAYIVVRALELRRQPSDGDGRA